MAAVRLVFTNNYDMARARAGWRAGIYPAHHLYGTAYLEREFDIRDVRYRDDDLLARGTRLTRGRLGDLGLQLRALARLHPGAIIYAAQARDVLGLAALRRSHLMAAPLVGVLHTWTSAPFSRALLDGFDHVITLSQPVRAELIERGFPRARVSALRWGPDLSFPGFAATARAAPDAPVVATGKSGRDFATLVEAFRRTRAAARVYCDRPTLSAGGPLPEAVSVCPSVMARAAPNAPLTYAHTVQDLTSAAVIAIPLSQPRPYQGMTELADAIACARPVIVTRSPYLDVDVEAVGCGWFVDQGDVDGWTAAIIEALSDRDRLAAMGEAGRRWAAENWNDRLFAAGLRTVLAGVGG